MEQVIPAGTIVHIGGFPFELTEDTTSESATTLETALNSQNVERGNTSQSAIMTYQTEII